MKYNNKNTKRYEYKNKYLLFLYRMCLALILLLPMLSETVVKAADGPVEPEDVSTYFGSLGDETVMIRNISIDGFELVHWYVTASDPETVTLFSKESFGSASYNHTSCGKYLDSGLRTTVESLTDDGKPLAGIRDVLAPLNVDGVGAVPYVPNKQEVNSLSWTIRHGDGKTWWVRDKVDNQYAWCLYVYIKPTYEEFMEMNVYEAPRWEWDNTYREKKVWEYAAIRPAVRLDLSKVNYNPRTRTFSVRHTHNWDLKTDKASPNTAIVKCTEKDCPYVQNEEYKFSISVEDKECDGSPVGPYLHRYPGFPKEIYMSKVRYTGRNATVYNSSTAPSDEGEYTVSIYLSSDEGIPEDNRITLSDDFKIGKESVGSTSVKALTDKEKAIKVKVKAGSHIYNGEEQILDKTELIVTAGSSKEPLSESDYEVYYTDNINAGKAKVVVTGKGNYAGTVSKTFKIKPDKTADIRVEASEKMSFSPEGVIPEIKATASMSDNKETELKEGVDYKVTASKNKAVGTAGYTLKFLGNYKGHTLVKGSYEIKALELSSENTRVFAGDMIYKNPGKYYSKVYVDVGSDIENKGGVLANAKDYTVEYYLGEASGSSLEGLTKLDPKKKLTLNGDSETITVAVTGKGNLSGGPVLGSYRVVKPSDSSLVLTKAKVCAEEKDSKGKNMKVPKQSYSGAAVEPSVRILVKQGKQWVTVPEDAYMVSYINNKVTGKAYILVTGTGYSVDDLTAVGSVLSSFTITRQ
ncbi:MAG: hypothetical protein K6E33_08185 [Lachnospiraceae bacterium]|nr:hypothetical protein [Lachnospiraceae bacterium]